MSADLQELFDRTATSPVAPIALDDVVRRGRRRNQRQLAGVASAVLLVLVGGANLLPGGGTDPVPVIDRVPEVEQPREPAPAPADRAPAVQEVPALDDWPKILGAPAAAHGDRPSADESAEVEVVPGTVPSDSAPPTGVTVPRWEWTWTEDSQGWSRDPEAAANYGVQLESWQFLAGAGGAGLRAGTPPGAATVWWDSISVDLGAEYPAGTRFAVQVDLRGYSAHPGFASLDLHVAFKGRDRCCFGWTSIRTTTAGEWVSFDRFLQANEGPVRSLVLSVGRSGLGGRDPGYCTSEATCWFEIARVGLRTEPKA